jgi:hypothetical protein
MFGLGLWNPAKKPDKARARIRLRGRTYPGCEPNMSELGLWNLNKEPNKAERPDMFGLGAGHVRPEPLETGLGAGYVCHDRRFWW